jgi:DNA-binding NarL/FixJ family response regulator
MDVIRIIIVDDHGIIRQGLQRLLNGFSGMSVVGVAASGEEAVALAATASPHVVLMDLEMPGAYDGVEATRRVIGHDPDVRVVILTSFSDRERILRAFDAGAIGYVLKDGPAEELERAVRAAARGDFPVDPKAARILFDRHREPDPLAVLSSREQEVLSLVGAGLPNKEIGRRLGITERTVKGHLTGIYRTIHVDDRTQAALWAQRAGLSMSGGGR